MMDSSFLTWINVGLALYSAALFLKLVIQFGLPNHPVRSISYLVSLSATAFFGMKALTGLGFLSPWFYMKWSLFPMVIAGAGLLFQVISSISQFSRIQQKIVSRLPIFSALICFGLFPTKDTVFFTATIGAGCLFLLVSKDKARYQKRTYLKMTGSLLVFGAFRFLNVYWGYVVGELFLFLALFYFYVFQQAFAVSALIEDRAPSEQGVRR